MLLMAIGGICTMINLLYNLKRGYNKTPLFLFIVFVDLSYTLLVSWIINSYCPELIDVFPIQNNFTAFFIEVIAGPLIETFLFQFLVIELFFYLKERGVNIKDLGIVWTSSILFSVTHYYNFVYILIIIFPGLLYASYYLFLKKEKQNFIFIKVFGVHAISNCVAFLVDNFP